MANSFHSISEINTSETCWNLKARILRLWLVNDLNKNALPFSVELVLMDAQVKITFIFFYCSYLANNVTYFLQSSFVVVLVHHIYHHNNFLQLCF